MKLTFLHTKQVSFAIIVYALKHPVLNTNHIIHPVGPFLNINAARWPKEFHPCARYYFLSKPTIRQTVNRSSNCSQQFLMQ